MIGVDIDAIETTEDRENLGLECWNLGSTYVEGDGNFIFEG